MTPVLLAPVMLPGFLSETSASVCSAVIVSFTALVYLAMICSPFLHDFGDQSPEHKQSEDTFQRGAKK